MSKEMVGSNMERPSFLHGTNHGRVDVKIRPPGEVMKTEGKAKANPVSQNLLTHAMDGEAKNEGGYKE